MPETDHHTSADEQARRAIPGRRDHGDPQNQPCCLPTQRRGWSPPLLPADTPTKKLVDRIMPRSGAMAIAYFAAVIVALSLAPQLPRRPELLVDGLAALAGGGWCALNFWRCRHAHCAITGAGWLALSLFCLLEAALGRSLIHGDEQLIFVAVLAVAVAFEFGWWAQHGTNVVSRNARHALDD